MQHRNNHTLFVKEALSPTAIGGIGGAALGAGLGAASAGKGNRLSGALKGGLLGGAAGAGAGRAFKAMKPPVGKTPGGSTGGWWGGKAKAPSQPQGWVGPGGADNLARNYSPEQLAQFRKTRAGAPMQNTAQFNKWYRRQAMASHPDRLMNADAAARQAAAERLMVLNQMRTAVVDHGMPLSKFASIFGPAFATFVSDWVV